MYYVGENNKKEASGMTDTERVVSLELENNKLRADNDMLLNIIAQMKVTLNRLVHHYINDNDN